MHPVIFYGPWGVYLNLVRVHQWKIAGIGCKVYKNWLHTSGKRSSCEHPRITLYAPVIKLRRGVDRQKGLNPHLKLCGFPGVQWPQSLSNTRRLRSESSRSFTKMCNPAKRGDQEQDFRCPLQNRKNLLNGPPSQQHSIRAAIQLNCLGCLSSRKC